MDTEEKDGIKQCQSNLNFKPVESVSSVTETLIWSAVNYRLLTWKASWNTFQNPRRSRSGLWIQSLNQLQRRRGWLPRNWSPDRIPCSVCRLSSVAIKVGYFMCMCVCECVHACMFMGVYVIIMYLYDGVYQVYNNICMWVCVCVCVTVREGLRRDRVVVLLTGKWELKYDKVI